MGARKADAADFHSARDQQAAIEQAVERLGGVLEVLPPELDVSGGLPLEQRPSLLAAVEGVESGRYCGVIVAYQSRLGRDVGYEEAVWRRVEAAGGMVEMALDGLDTKTVDGKMVRRIRSALNAADRERHVERFAQLREWATAAGIWQRRQTPLGYTRDPQTRRLVPTPDAARVVAAFRQRAAGGSVTSIADLLGMTTSGARQLLRNRVYLGELRVGEHVNPAAHPPLVTVDEWEQAQVSIPRPARSGRPPALLAGLVRCQGCGHVMSRAVTASVVYACQRRSSAGRCPEPAAITARLLDEHVEEAVLGELVRLSSNATDAGGRVDAAREVLAVAERELAAYLSAVSAADVGAEAFAGGARQRRERVDEARGELSRRLAVRPVVDATADGLGLWEGMDDQGRNLLLRALLEVVIVRRGGGRGSRTAVADRVRVVAAGGTGLAEPRKSSGNALGVAALRFPNLDDEGVLRVPGSEDAL